MMSILQVFTYFAYPACHTAAVSAYSACHTAAVSLLLTTLFFVFLVTAKFSKIMGARGHKKQRLQKTAPNVQGYRSAIGTNDNRQKNKTAHLLFAAPTPTTRKPKQLYTQNENQTESLSQIKEVAGHIRDASNPLETAGNLTGPLIPTLLLWLSTLRLPPGNRTLNAGNGNLNTTTIAPASLVDDSWLTTVTPQLITQLYETAVKSEKKRLKRNLRGSKAPKARTLKTNISSARTSRTNIASKKAVGTMRKTLSIDLDNSGEDSGADSGEDSRVDSGEKVIKNRFKRHNLEGSEWNSEEDDAFPWALTTPPPDDCFTTDEFMPFLNQPLARAIWNALDAVDPLCAPPRRDQLNEHALALAYAQELLRQVYGARNYEKIPHIDQFIKPLCKSLLNNIKGNFELWSLLYHDPEQIGGLILAASLPLTKLREKKCVEVDRNLIVPGATSYVNTMIKVSGGATGYIIDNGQVMGQVYDGNDDEDTYKPVWYSPSHNRWFWKAQDGDIIEAKLNHKKTRARHVGEKDGIKLYRLIPGKDDTEVLGKDYFLTKSNKLVPHQIIKKAGAGCWNERVRRCTEGLKYNRFSLLKDKFCKPLWVVSPEPPEKVLKNGFTQPCNFERIPQMIENRAIIASEIYDKALDLLAGKVGEMYLYEINAENINGVSLLNNINNNPENLAKFLGIDFNKKVDWVYGTGGAMFFAEAHINAADIKPSSIDCLGSKWDLRKELKDRPSKFFA